MGLADDLFTTDPLQPESTKPCYELGDGFYFEYDDASNHIGGYHPANLYLLKVDDPDFKRCMEARTINRAKQA